METMRVFIAVDIGDDIRAGLDELQRKLKKVHADVRWVKPRNMHLTLAFLGDVPPDQIDDIKQVLDHACEGHAPFGLNAAGTGFFGKPRYPRVIWAGIADCPALAKLQHRIATGLMDAGIAFDDKPFSPHLTLGRVKAVDQHTAPLLQKIDKYQDIEFGETRIDHLELIQSTLTPRGAEYTVLHRAKLEAY